MSGLADLSEQVRHCASSISRQKGAVAEIGRTILYGAWRFENADEVFRRQALAMGWIGLDRITDSVPRLLLRFRDGGWIERALLCSKYAKSAVSLVIAKGTRRWVVRTLPGVRHYLNLGPRGGAGPWSGFIRSWKKAVPRVSGIVSAGLEFIDSVHQGDSLVRSGSNAFVVGSAAYAGAAIGSAVAPGLGTLAGFAVGLAVSAATDWVLNTGGEHSVKNTVGDFVEGTCELLAGNRQKGAVLISHGIEGVRANPLVGAFVPPPMQGTVYTLRLLPAHP
jgi:hypothetical protein